MIEPEMAFCDLQGDMDAGRGVCQSHGRVCAGALRRRPQLCSPSSWTRACIERLKFVVERPFQRVPYTEAMEILQAVRQDIRVSRCEYGLNLQSEHERFLTEEHFKSPGDRVQLSARDQAVLHAAKRRTRKR